MELLGKKIGMTQIFDGEGHVVPVTVIEAGPCYVVQLKSKENDGYSAVQIGFGYDKKLAKGELGHLKKAGVEKPLKYLHEMRVDKLEEFKLGQELKVDGLKPGDRVKVSGKAIGKGFQGSIKRHHFSRGPMTHGSKNHRGHGTIGAGTSPGRIEKGTRMAGRMGGKKVTQSTQVIQVVPEKNLLLVRGGVPGADSTLVVIKKS